MANGAKGLLWLDDDPNRSLADKVLRAAERYQQKFGAAANICYVHPSALNGGGDTNGVAVQASQTVLPHHFLIVREVKEG